MKLLLPCTDNRCVNSNLGVTGMRKFVALGAIAALALGAQTAAAEGFSYNLIEGSYATGDVESVDLDGFGVKGSWELAPSIFVLGGLQNLEFDGGASLDSLN